jgi:hypothetical protein
MITANECRDAARRWRGELLRTIDPGLCRDLALLAQAYDSLAEFIDQRLAEQGCHGDLHHRDIACAGDARHKARGKPT